MDCAICFELLTDSDHVLTPCNHHFCATCITQWAMAVREPTCPICRGDLTGEYTLASTGEVFEYPAYDSDNDSDSDTDSDLVDIFADLIASFEEIDEDGLRLLLGATRSLAESIRAEIERREVMRIGASLARLFASEDF